MDLRTELSYDAGADDVFAMLCDEDFRTEVCEATRAVRHELSIASTNQGTTVRTSRLLVAPDLAKKFVGETIEIVQVEEWGLSAADGTRTADLSVDIPGKPASMRGTIVLAAAGSGSVETISGDVRVKIPLVGGKLESEVARALLAGIEEEGKVGRRWLAR